MVYLNISRLSMTIKPKFLSILLWNLIILLVLQVDLSAQNSNRYTISGYVKDAANGEALIGASIQDTKSKKGAGTNTFGFYSLTLPKSDTVVLLVTYLGYKPKGYTFILRKGTHFSVKNQIGRAHV